MKTTFNKPACISTILYMLIVILSLNSCNCIKKSCRTKNVFKGDRVYYDFYKKELFKDESRKDTLKRPLIMKENKEIQIEITQFNPLKYSIILEDSAYNSFVSNVEDFNRLFILPSSIKTDAPEEIITPSVPGFRDQKTDLITEIVNYSDTLKKRINTYKTFLGYIENITNVYDYLKSKEVLTKWEIKQEIKSNITDPIDAIFKVNELYNSSSEVFKSEFIDDELYLYGQIKDLKTIFNELKGRTASSGQPERDKFDSYFNKIMSTMDEFNETRVNKVLPNFNKTMLVYEKLQSLTHSDPFFVTKSYSINKDIQIINIFKYDLDSRTKLLHDAVKIQLTGGIRIDASGGIFVSGLYDKKYSLYTDSSLFYTAQDTIMKKGTSIHVNTSAKVSFGGIMFLQIHSENASNLNYGGFVGIGALFNDQTRLSASGGLSLIFGRSQRFFLNLGSIISQVDRLSKPYVVNKFYQKDFESIPTTKVWKCSWMIGTSWKIGK